MAEPLGEGLVHQPQDAAVEHAHRTERPRRRAAAHRLLARQFCVLARLRLGGRFELVAEPQLLRALLELLAELLGVVGLRTALLRLVEQPVAQPVRRPHLGD